MRTHEKYIRRCFDLARLGAQSAAPNPMVGSVIVHDDRIIGEGFHKRQGAAHAEVNAVASVLETDRHLLPESTMYVSLEPCCHHGLTPPCTDLIRSERIPRVVISTTDPSSKVAGNGIRMLRESGIEVITGVLEQEGIIIAQDFFVSATKQRPFVQLKYVQSSDLYIGHPDRQVWLSNAYEKTMVHKMRSEADAIMVGTNTAICDNPMLTTREYHGKSPVRVTFDRTLRIPQNSKLFDGSVKTIVYTESQSLPDIANTEFVSLSFDENLLQTCLKDLVNRGIHTLMVEGGSALIKSLDEHGLWDEAWIVTTKHVLGQGIKAPILNGRLVDSFSLENDRIVIMHPERTNE